MADKKKTKTVLLEELSNLRQQVRQLEVSEKRYRDFVENVEDACLEMDLTGRFTFANKALFSVIGYSREDFSQMARWQFFPTREESDRITTTYHEIYQTGIPRKIVDYSILHKDGSVRNFEASVSLIRNEEGNPVGFRGIGRDVTEQKAAEAQQERYRNFIENIEDFCFETDLAGNFTFVNHAMLNRFGFTIEDAMGMNFKTYIKPDEVHKIFSEFHNLYLTGKPLSLLDYGVVHKDGSIITLEGSISLICDAQGNPVGFRGISRDVTEKRKTVDILERYKNFVENVFDICWESDLDGNFTFINSAVLRRLGFSKEDFKKINYKQYTTPEEAGRIYQIFNDMYQTGVPITAIDHEIILSDGQVRYMELSASLKRDSAGKPVGIRGISRDVTEKRKMEADQENYRAFIENIEDGCWEIDLNGYCTFCNQATLDQFGYSAEEQKIITSKDYTTPEEGKRIRRIYTEMFRTGRPIKVHDQEIIRKDGSIRILEVSASVIRDASGKIIGARGINRDVTEHKRMKTEQEKLIAQFNQAQKMEALGTLSGGIAHDFNNLLMGIQGYASLILFNTDPTHPNYEKLKAIESQVQSGANLTKQLLGYARSGRYEVNPIDLNDFIKKTTNMFGRTKKEIRLFENYGESLWLVEADAGQLEQVFLNLFVNAWQAMPGGGSLYVETQNVTLDEFYIRPYNIIPGHYVKVTVTDTGVGMDKETQQRIFEPFFTTKTMGRGTGLGLASVYGIIKGHKGIINVYSEKGHGTSFNIYLPVSQKKLISKEPVVSEIRGGHETILLVDDENVITDVTGQMLTGLGYQIFIADSGEKAIEIYKESPGRIDLVIMDMIMPAMGGGETFRAIKAINPKVKVILSSGYTLNDEAKQIMDQGVLAFLQKPYNQDELSRKVREILDQAEPPPI
jgi:two-component system, cell cycle sensor histidine kinase and response regulator CckA